MNTTRLILVRHGETQWNREHRIQGQLDIQLNATGLEQARALAKALTGERIDRALSSDLDRAMATARIALDGRGLAIQAEPGWRERHFGIMQGERFEDWSTLHPESYAAYFLARDPAPPEGETVAAFRARVVAALDALAHVGGTTLVLTHGGVLSVLYRHVHALPDDARRTWGIPNAGINEFVRDGDSWRMVRFADVRHLEQPLAA
jgi:probable phosphoglycerate mutase